MNGLKRRKKQNNSDIVQRNRRKEIMKLEHTEKAIKLLSDRIKLMERYRIINCNPGEKIKILTFKIQEDSFITTLGKHQCRTKWSNLQLQKCKQD